MIILQDIPTLTELHDLINRVDHYPITAGEIVKLAEEEHSPLSVSDFYRSFHSDEAFEDAEDLWTRTEQVEMMHHMDAPAEVMYAPEED